MPRSGSRSCCATVGTITIKTIGGKMKNDNIQIDRKSFYNAMMNIDCDVLYCNEKVDEFEILDYKEDMYRFVFMKWSKN